MRRPRIMSSDELMDLRDDELARIRLAYKQIVHDLENEIADIRERGGEVNNGKHRELRNYKACLGFAKDITSIRIQPMFRETIGELTLAVRAILADDEPDEAAWDRLQAAYEAMPAPYSEWVDA